MQLADAVKGLFLGMLLGALIGLGVCIWIIDGPWLFYGDTMVIGGLLCSLLGYLFGEDFFDFLRERWHWFT